MLLSWRFGRQTTFSSMFCRRGVFCIPPTRLGVFCIPPTRLGVFCIPSTRLFLIILPLPLLVFFFWRFSIQTTSRVLPDLRFRPFFASVHQLVKWTFASAIVVSGLVKQDTDLKQKDFRFVPFDNPHPLKTVSYPLSMFNQIPVTYFFVFSSPIHKCCSTTPPFLPSLRFRLLSETESLLVCLSLIHIFC